MIAIIRMWILRHKIKKEQKAKSRAMWNMLKAL